MEYKITIYDCPVGWVKNETTNQRSRLYELREKAAKIAREVIKNLGKESARNNHFVYYYEMPETFMGKKTGKMDVRVYMRPYMADEETFYSYIDRCKPDIVGAIHGNNLCRKFFEK